MHRARAGGRERRRAAVRLRDQNAAAEASLREALLERRQVALDDRPHVGVHDRRARALVLAPLLAERVRHGDGDAGQLLGEDRGGAPLVSRIKIGEEERHGDRLDALGRERARSVADGGFIQRHEYFATRADALGHLEAASARNERSRSPIQNVVHPQEVAAPDLDDVTEAFGGDEPRARALAFEQGIDADGRAVNRQPTIGEIDAGLIRTPQHAVEQRGRCTEGLGIDHGPRRLVERREVRERSTDVDADPKWHRRFPGARQYT